MKIALTGNPNCGKTAMFNTLTGKVEHVGNWAGVTVEKKEAKIKRSLSLKGERETLVDLPGAYSMSPYTLEESITRDFIIKESPDVIINVVDATQLSRSLFLTTQLKELNIPMVIALNKCDTLHSRGITLNEKKLAELLDCPVVKTVAIKLRNNGIGELLAEARNIEGGFAPALSRHQIPGDKTEAEEQDKRRFEIVAEIVEQVEDRLQTSTQPTLRSRVDQLLTNKWLGIPVFAGVIWLVFSISQSWLGPWLADTFVGWIDALYGVVDGALDGAVHPFLQSLISDGIIGGVGAVVGFLPLIMVLFFLLALLEDCGYMARVAMIMDRGDGPMR